MGVIDKSTYTLTCTKCGATSSASVLDRGSGWGGSSWGDGAAFSGFKTEWVGGGNEEPELKLAACEKCGIPATVTLKYSQ